MTTTKTFPLMVIEVPRQLPPTAWVAHSDRDLIEACVPYCERAGEPYPEDAAGALGVLGHDLYALVTVTQEEWEAAHACASPEEVLGLPVHQRIKAYSAALDAALREGWQS